METSFILVKANKMSKCDGDVCRIDAVVTMDVKGQIVLPKDLREKANFKPNDKIAVVACEKEGVVCCIMMIKAERLADAVSKTLGPLLKGAIEQEG
jgi:AbrB family looped-hinge helix DNA binding protein